MNDWNPDLNMQFRSERTKKRRNLSTVRRLLFLAGVFLLSLGLFTTTPILSPNPAAAAEKETICHVSPGHPGHFRTLSIPGKAARAHLARHPLDHEGECCESDADCDTGDACTIGLCNSGTCETAGAPCSCNNEADVAIVQNPDFLDEDGPLEVCGQTYPRPTAAELAACLEDRSGLSAGCAPCYGEFAECWRDDCGVACSSDDPEACEACATSTSCTAEFELCAGFSYPAPPLPAGTYKSFTCGCFGDECADGDDDCVCSCEFSYHLGPWQTKEFRGYCNNGGFLILHPCMRVGGQGKPTTCTTSNYWEWGNYCTKSCTYWGLNGDTVYPKVQCEKF